MKTTEFQGRKLIFEEIFSKQFPEYEVFQFIEYTSKIDGILLRVFQKSSLYMSEFFDRVSHSCYTKSEIRYYFDTLYQMLSKSTQDMVLLMDEIEEIMREFRSGNTPVTRQNASQISKTIFLIKILGETVNRENIQKYFGLYIFIPSLFGSTHGESNTAINMVKGFVKTQKPQSVSHTEKNINFAEILLMDAENIEWFRKKKMQIKLFMKKFAEKSGAQKLIELGKRTRNSLGEKKLQVFLSYQRKSHPDTLGKFSLQDHIELMKKYFMIRKVLSNIESDLHIKEGKVEQKPKIHLLRLLVGRGKTEGFGPFVTKIWLVVSRLGPVVKLLGFIPFIKIQAIFAYMAYKTIDICISLLSYLSVFQRYKRFSEIQGNHRIEATPDMQDFFIENAGNLSYINTQINALRVARKLKGQAQKIELEIEEMHNSSQDTVNIERKLLDEKTQKESQSQDIRESIDATEVRKKIFDIRQKFLSLLDEASYTTTKSFLK